MRKITKFIADNLHLFFWPLVAVLIFIPAFGKYTMFPAPDATPVYSASFKTNLAIRFVSDLHTVSLDDVLKIALPPLFYHDFAYWLAVVLVALGFFWFMRERGVARLAALFSAGAMAFAGYSFTLLSAGHMDYFSMWPYVVFTFAFLTRAVCRSELSCYALAACTAAWAFRYGPDIAPQFLVIAAAYAIYLNIRRQHRENAKTKWFRFAKGCALALLAFGLMAAPSIVNVCTNTLSWRKEQIAKSSGTPLASASETAGAAESENDTDAIKKQEQWIFATNWSLPPEECVEFVAPGVYGTWTGDQSAPYWGRLGRSDGFDFKRPQQTGFFNFRQHLVYLGAMPIAFLVFAAACCIANMRRRDVADGEEASPHEIDVPFWLAVWIIALLLAFGRYAPFYRIFYSIPYMSYLRAPVKFFRIVEFATMTLAASGLSALLSDRVGDKLRKGLGYGAFAASAALAIYAMRINASAGTFAADLGRLGAAPLMKPMAIHAIHALWHGILGFALVGAVAFAVARRRVACKVAAAVLSVALAVDAWIATRPFMFTADFRSWYAPNCVTKAITSDVGDSELGALMTLGVQRVPEWFTKSLAAFGIRGLPVESADNNGFISRTRGDITRLCKVSGASHLLMPVSLSRSIDRSAFEHVLFAGFSASSLVETKTPNATSLELLRLREHPRFCKLYADWKYADENGWTDAVADSDEDVTAIVGKDIPAPGKRNDGKAATVLQSRVGTDGKFDTVIEVDTPNDAICVAGHFVAPDLRALVDGTPSEIIPCGFAKFVGVHVPAGRHVVTFGFTHHPAICAFSTLAMVAFFVCVVLKFAVRREK